MVWSLGQESAKSILWGAVRCWCGLANRWDGWGELGESSEKADRTDSGNSQSRGSELTWQTTVNTRKRSTQAG